MPRSTAGPVFVVGSPRSGTSVLSWALAQHPDFATGPEADIFYFLARQSEIDKAWERARGREDGWFAVKGVERAEFMAALGSGLSGLFQRHSEGKRWVDSSPSNSMVCPELAEMFADASFVHILRDGRAAVASMIKSGFDARIARDFEFACDTWEACARMAHEYAEANPERAIELRQEDMSEDPEGTMERVLRFLGVEPVPEVAAFLSRGRLNSSWGNERPEDVRRHKDAGVVPAAPWLEWTASMKRTFRSRAGKTMEALGYEPLLD